MIDTTEYQGHKNWATWNASLWLNNDEFFYSLLSATQSADELREVVETLFKVNGRFGDITDSDELDNIDFEVIFTDSKG